MNEWGPVGRQPYGLLDFFQLKNLGQNPRNLSDLIQGQIDLDPLYKVNAEELILVAQNAVAANGWVSPTPGGGAVHPFIPQGEVWHVHAVTAQFNFTAAGTAQYWVASRQEVGSYLISGEALDGAAWALPRTMAIGDLVQIGTNFGGRGRFFPPATRFGIYGSLTGAAAFNLNLTVRFSRLKF